MIHMQRRLLADMYYILIGAGKCTTAEPLEPRAGIEATLTKEVRPYRITNLRGLVMRTGQRAKQRTKHARAPRLQAPNMSSRSQRLTR